MIYILACFMLTSGYYTLTYGISIYKEDSNKLGGYASIAVAVLGTLLPIIILFLKQTL
jgi:ABC-type maltose transport system permease subunit